MALRHDCGGGDYHGRVGDHNYPHADGYAHENDCASGHVHENDRASGRAHDVRGQTP